MRQKPQYADMAARYASPARSLDPSVGVHACRGWPTSPISLAWGSCSVRVDVMRARAPTTLRDRLRPGLRFGQEATWPGLAYDGIL